MDGLYWVYIIENKTNGKKYVGKTKNLQLRWKNHINLSKKGIGYHIHSAIAKYGIDNFWYGGVCFCFSEKEAFELEKEIIKINKSNNSEFGYNLTEGGDGASGYKHTPEAKYMLSELAKTRIGPLNPFFGKTQNSKTVDEYRGEKNKKAKMTEKQIINMIEDYYTGNFTEQDLGDKYKVNRSTVHDILIGKRWKHIPRNIELINQIKLTNKVIGKNISIGFNNPNSKLTEEKVLAIYNDTRKPAIIAKEYDLHVQTVYDIRNGTKWAHIIKNQK